MYISKLKIENYRNFSNIELDLRPFTLIIGENNIGKTNLLNAIGLIFSQEITIFKKRFLEIDDFNYDSIMEFKRKVANRNLPTTAIELPIVKIEVTLTDFLDEQSAIVADWCIDRQLSKAKITYEFAPQLSFKKDDWIAKQRESPDLNCDKIDFPIDSYEYHIFGGDDSSNRCDLYFLRMLKMEFLDALRDAKKELVANSDNRLLYKILNRKESSNYSKIKDVLSSLNEEITKNHNLLEIKKDVNILLDKVSLTDKNTVNEIDFDFSSPETSEILKKLSLTYGTNPISVERNGLGRNNLLYITLLLSQIVEEQKFKAEQSIRDFTAFRIIAIEEPEAHLHPNLQNHLSQNIENIGYNKKHLQIILTSHSTHISSNLKLANTLVLFKEGIKIKSHYILDGLDLNKDKDSINYLSKYLDATKSTMFYSRKIILVEGIAEQLLLPKFFEKVTGSTLEKENCNVINVNGVSFSHFLKIIKNGFFIKCVVFTDSDFTKRTKNRAPALKRAYSKEFIIDVQITNQETFEKDLIEANKSGIGKNTLLEALQKTKTKLCNRKNVSTYKISIGNSDLDVNSFFDEIENYKSEFAFNLLDQMNNNLDSVIVPSYIEKGLKFLTT
ncbi:ATP-dependent nuclease [Flavobacterium tistrianum]|uniref:ATP-dependent nuclease n=1 Tax=Flavobacterium tistrianum TaxID=1685414 RepID=UPI000DABB5A2|nr:AAA family ATPase [Flavobacterium tistrianum]KAF2342276.1 AAA family ATPase [Flavobacterium tistrianum]